MNFLTALAAIGGDSLLSTIILIVIIVVVLIVIFSFVPIVDLSFSCRSQSGDF